MHLSEGIISAPVLMTGTLGAIGGISLGLRRTPTEAVPRVAVLSAVFFIASLIHVPFGPGSVHLILNGLAGLLLGWGAFVAIGIGLILQALFFGYGGVTVWGVNTVTMAVGAVVAGGLVRPCLRKARTRTQWFVCGAVCGAASIGLSGLLMSLALSCSGREFRTAAGLLLAAHVPIMIIEGVITGGIAAFLQRVQPELLTGTPSPVD